MRILIWLFITFISTIGFATEFTCEGAEKIETMQKQKFKISGEIVGNGILTNVSAEIFESEDPNGHEIVSNRGPLSMDVNFRPRAEKLKNYSKFIIEQKFGDSFLLYLPKIIDGQTFTAYFKMSYNGTFPDLETVECERR